MGELRVSAWKRHGKERLYVNRPDGAAVAWFDQKTGHLEVLPNGSRDEILEALTPYLTRCAVSPTPPLSAQGPTVAQTSSLPSAYDLALNEPGASLRAKLAELSPGLFGRSLAWLLRRRTEADSWRSGLVGERVVGRELARLDRHGWRTLHSIPLSPKNDIDHLLIGPGGVFTINTKNYPGMDVWVGDDSVTINRGPGRPHVRKSRAEAVRARDVLQRGCGFPVAVKPLLVFVKPARLDVVPTLHDVRALGERQLASYAPLAGVLLPKQVDAVYAVARDRRNWGRS
ncbi:nuclease-related domain-containing protein [Streptomyces sp. NPDC088197]|uniref:nuclease-related domain-containing protein n=1 Tax=Streptomyces sp. NPDC088197 TaxID=3365840 RepID=UPI0038254725